MVSHYLPQLLLAWSIQAVGALSPGPSVALILGVAVTRGRPPSLVTALGIACGSVVLSLGTALGVAVVFANVAELASIIRFVGAAYLAWLAVKAFRAAAAPGEALQVRGTASGAWRTGLSGFVLQVSNPKAIMFWLAIASVGGVGDAPAWAVAVFVAGAFAISFTAHGGYALLLSAAPTRRAYARAHRWIEGALGCFFLFASYRLVTARL